MSNFIDFNQYRDLNQADEQKQLERALENARGADQRAQNGLRASGREAAGRYDTNGQISGEKALSDTASFTDYLQAKKDAGAAWAAVNARSADPRLAALQSTMGGDRQGADLGAQEAAAGATADAGLASRGRERTQQAADTEMKKQALAAREKQGEEAKARYLDALTKGAQGRAAAGGAQTDYVGGYNPYANSQWAVQQGAWEAQQAKNAGVGDAQQKGIWDAYTGKGGLGSTGSAASAGAPGRNLYTNMQEAMAPYAPDKEED